MKPSDCYDLYKRAEFYDLMMEGLGGDVEMYKSLASQKGNKILELACGTGRITIPLAESGFQVTGIDLNPEMLRLARSKSAHLTNKPELVEADVRSFSLNKKFDLIFFPINSICHLHDRESLEAMLQCVRNHLAEEGCFVVSIFVPDPAILSRKSDQRYPVAKFEHPDHGQVVITENNVYEQGTQINRIKWYYKTEHPDSEFVVENNMRMFYPCEFQDLLFYNGFKVADIFGGYSMKPFTSESTLQIYCATSST